MTAAWRRRPLPLVAMVAGAALATAGATGYLDPDGGEVEQASARRLAASERTASRLDGGLPSSDALGPATKTTRTPTAVPTTTGTAPAPAPVTTTTTTVPVAPPAGVAWDSEAVGERGVEALALITYPWQDRLPGWQIRFHQGIDGAYGYTLTQERIIDIYVRDGQSTQLLAHVIAHELGHAVDVTLNDGDDRHRWQQTRGIEAAPWWPDNRATDFSTGAGDFAESFAAWQVGTADYRSKLADPPTAEQLAVLTDLAGE